MAEAATETRHSLLRFITCGSVDDGKSTLVGRLLFESQGIFEDQLEALTRAGEDGIDLASLTDGLRAEREQGITIDVAYRYFNTPKRKFIIADAPGHESYTRNMATAASNASLAVILVDAERGVTTQSRRHSFIATLLGIPHLVVAVNKMDLVGYDEGVFETIRREFSDFAAKLNARDLTFIPVSALKGDNVVHRSERMPWYGGGTLLNHLETVHVASDRNLIDMRFPVQYVHRKPGGGRAYMGSVGSGVIRPGDEVMVVPGGEKSRVQRILSPEVAELPEAFPPLPVTVELEDEIDVSRGDTLVHVHNVPQVERLFEAMVIWMDQEAMAPGKSYQLKHGTRTVPATVGDLRYRVNVNTFHREQVEALNLNEIGRVVVRAGRPLAFDPYAKNRGSGSFVIIDRFTNNTVGAGMILDREPQELLRSQAPWLEASPLETLTERRGRVPASARAARLGQTPFTVWLTGRTGSGKTTVGQTLEQRLFDAGYLPYVLDGENVRLRLSRDLGSRAADRTENVRRVAETARILNEAGLIAICSLVSPYQADRDRAREVVGEDRFLELGLKADEAVLRERKPDLYAKADSGALRNFPGVTGPYELPANSERVLDTGDHGVDAVVDRIMEILSGKGWITS